MGVKHLWTVLTPFCDRKPLYELQGKTVAVDLSCWICEALNIAEYQVQPRMYLRNLYFRTCYLLLMDVNPVFVLEGKAPELKYDTIAARNAIQFKGAKPKTDGVKTGKDRSRFHYVLKQCEEMLGYMGIVCITGLGEAESLCAYLNEDGLVDGCISQDSDCFAYGAQVVYRNFSISTQGVQSASGGAVDVYDIRKANQSLNFGRHKIVAMALLIGSDYSEGIHGIGKDSVFKFFETVSDREVLDRLRSWRKNVNMYEKYEKQLNDKNICTSCGHSGKIQNHTKNGCNPCKTTKGCDPFKYKDERLAIKNEVTMRNKAMLDPKFPNEDLIKEFLHRKDNVTQLDLTWKQPNIVKFVRFTTKFLQWEELYAFEKILPVMTRWQCRNPELLKDERKLKGVLKPDRIKKIRNPKGVPSYEIIWNDPGEYFKGLIPENQLLENNVDMEKLWSSIEPQNLVEHAYPDLVEAYKQSKIKPKKAAKRKKKDQLEELTDKLENVSLVEQKRKKTRKPRVPKELKTLEDVAGAKTKDVDTETLAVDDNMSELNTSLKLLSIDEVLSKPTVQEEAENQKGKQRARGKQTNKLKTLDSFVKKAITNSHDQKTRSNRLDNNKDTGKNCFNNVSTPVKSTESDLLPFDFDMSTFGDESDLDLSDIIDDIVSKKPLGLDLRRIADKYVDNHEVICLEDTADDVGNCCDEDNDAKTDDVNCSSFFMKNHEVANDIFEKTFNETFKHFDDDSSSDGGSDTEEYEFDGVGDKENENPGSNENIQQSEESANKEDVVEIDEPQSSDDDSFCDKNYVPLYERLKLKY